MVSVTIIGSTAASRGSLGLVHFRLVGVIIDVILTLRRRDSGNHTNRQSNAHLLV